MPNLPLLQSRKVPIWNLSDQLPWFYHLFWWDRHGIELHITHRGLAYSQVNDRHSSASRIHKLLPMIHPQIHQANGINLWRIREITRQMRMDPNGSAPISAAQDGIYWSSNLPAFRPSNAYHPPDGRKWLCNCWYSPPVQCCLYSQTRHLLLTKMLLCRTELSHICSGAPSHHGDFETMATLSQGSQSQNPDTVWPQESRVFRNVKSALLETSKMSGDPFFIRPCHPTLGRKQEPCK